MKYDLAVIGSGPAGQKAALAGAQNGLKTVVIDRRERKVGGVSLHAGTIPSKTLREAVLYVTDTGQQRIYGEERSRDEITIDKLISRVDSVLSHELDILENQFKDKGVEVVYGQASFKDSHTLEIRNHMHRKTGEIEADRILIATGSVPRHPLQVPFDFLRIFDSNFIFSSKSRLNKLPESMIVYGAGVIGLEYATMFAAMGVKVWLADKYETLLPFIDNEIIDLLISYLKDMGITFLMGERYNRIGIDENGKAQIELSESGNISADVLLFSKGRKPCVEPLELEKAGVKLNENGYIDVDCCFRTATPHIMACGDVIGFPCLASASAEQGRRAISYAVKGEEDSCRQLIYPMAIYTIPEISSFGLREEEVVAKGIPYGVAKASFSEVARATISGDDRGLLKMIYHKDTLELLGIHLIGHQSSEILHIGQVAMEAGIKLNFFAENVFNYPTWAEAYRTAAVNALT